MTLVRHSERTIRKGCYCHGRTDLYWAHDTEQTTYKTTSQYHAVGDPVVPCQKCGVTGGMVLINADSVSTEAGNPVPEFARHNTGNGDWSPADAPDKPASTPLPMPPRAITPAPVTVTDASNPQAAALAALQALLQPPPVDKAEIERLVKAEVQNIAFPTRTVVIHGDETVAVEGTTHQRLADVVLDLSINENVLMVGPAGTGKSTIAKQAAEALVFEYGELSLSPTITPTALLGYMSASGTYVRTVFREIWENGGVFHADEFDNGHPSTLATLNAALACSKGGAIAFPDGMISRHDDFRFVASANTFGRGPDRVYVGRQQLDAATLDRFVVEEIAVDESLEHAACIATGYESPKVSEVLRYVRQLRKNADKHKMTLIFSPRASIGMCKLLHAGKPLKATIEARVRKGISDSDWSKVTSDVSNPSV